jgi:hypothetical protein
MSETPETDERAVPHIGFYSCATVPAEFARKLERERDEARESTLRIDVLNFKLRKELDDAKSKIKSQADRIRYLEGATNHAKGTPLSVALRERDEAREVLKRIAHASMSARHKEEDYAEWEKAIESLQGICEEKNFINE